jgi:hypothetical protein
MTIPLMAPAVSVFLDVAAPTSHTGVSISEVQNSLAFLKEVMKLFKFL